MHFAAKKEVVRTVLVSVLLMALAAVAPATAAPRTVLGELFSSAG